MLALLDLDETLIDRRSAFTLWARRFVDAHDLGETEWTWLHDLDSTCRPRETFFAKVYARYGVGGSSTALWDDYRDQIPRLAEPFDGVTRELKLLRERRWRLFVVSNGKSDNQRAKLRRTGLAKLVDDSFISEEMGCKAPQRTILTWWQASGLGSHAPNLWRARAHTARSPLR